MREIEIDYKKLYEEEHKKYEGALGRARGHHSVASHYDNADEIQELEHIFPELKECKDEQIRKKLKSYFDSEISDYGNVEWRSGIYYGEVVAWLEKQGHDGKKWIYEDVYLKEKEQVYQDGIDEVLENPQKYGLEKQGEKNMDISEATKKKLEDNLNGEQKPTDRVEPKFKVGDWVAHDYLNNRHSVNQVTEVTQIDDKSYGYKLDDGTYFSGSFEKEYHLWTINDAKGGDVLVDNYGNILLYEEISSYTLYHSYCFGNENYFIEQGGAHMIDCTYPATKEQRDLLFTKMKEAGYEWDADKKELKKIEQTPTAYFYCKYGGTIPKCSDCVRNHLNSKYKTEEIKTWMTPAARGTKQCSDYIPQDSVNWNEEDVELTDFESALFSAFSDAWQEYLMGKYVNVVKWAKEHSAELLEVAKGKKPV